MRASEAGSPMPAMSSPSIVLPMTREASRPTTPPHSAKRPRTDDYLAHRSSPPAPTPTTTASPPPPPEPPSPPSASDLHAQTRPPLLNPSMLFPSFLTTSSSPSQPPLNMKRRNVSEGSTDVSVPPVDQPRPPLLSTKDLSAAATAALGDTLVPFPIPRRIVVPSRADVPSAPHSAPIHVADIEQPPWHELDVFLGEVGPEKAAKILYELGCTSVSRLIAHDPLSAVLLLF